MNEEQTLLEKLAQTLINLFLVSDELSMTREQYKATVAAVIKEAKAEAIAEIESRLGRNVDTAQECLEWWDELGDDEENDGGEWWCNHMEEDDNPLKELLEEQEEWSVMKGANGETFRIEQQPR